MHPVIRMFIFLIMGGALAALGGPRLGSPLGWVLVGLGLVAFTIGVWNFYLHARTQWPFRRDG